MSWELQIVERNLSLLFDSTEHLLSWNRSCENKLSGKLSLLFEKTGKSLWEKQIVLVTGEELDAISRSLGEVFGWMAASYGMKPKLNSERRENPLLKSDQRRVEPNLRSWWLLLWSCSMFWLLSLQIRKNFDLVANVKKWTEFRNEIERGRKSVKRDGWEKIFCLDLIFTKRDQEIEIRIKTRHKIHKTGVWKKGNIGFQRLVHLKRKVGGACRHKTISSHQGITNSRF